MIFSIQKALGLVLVAGLALPAAAQESSPPSATKITRIGELSYEAGFPTAATVAKLYEELDFQRAVLAYQYAVPLVDLNEMNEGMGKMGVNEGELIVFERFLDPHTVLLTGNSTTIYAVGFLDLAKEGPMVVEVTPGSYGAFFDLWQLTIAEVGPVGADKGEGGKFLVLPADYTGDIPEGYFPVRSRTTLAAYLARSLVKNGDVAGAAKVLEDTRIYPLAQAENPPTTKVVHGTGKDGYWNSPEGFPYWERVAKIVNRIPADEDGAFLMSLLKPLGIEPGKPFHPDARMKEILTDAAEVGYAMNQAISMAPRLKDATYYPGTQWTPVLMLDPALSKEFWRDLEPRMNYYFQAVMASPAMKEKAIGVGSQYLISARDGSGEWLDGSNHYRLHVPANVPAENFWSVTVYDYQTRSQIQNDTNIPARTSYDNLIANADGSVDLYFGPTAPEGKESNWVETIPDRGWFVWFRFYGPTEPYFDKTWQLTDFEKLQ